MELNNGVIIQWCNKNMPANATKVTGTWNISFKTKVKAWVTRQKADNNDSATINLDVTSCYASISKYIIYHAAKNSVALTDNIFGIGY